MEGVAGVMSGHLINMLREIRLWRWGKKGKMFMP